MRVFHRECWLAEHGVFHHGDPMPSCDGRLIKAHLIPRQILKRFHADTDPRGWVWACGGPTGLGGHHGMLDYSRTLTVPRTDLPPLLIELALEHGLMWWLDKHYGRSRVDYDDR